LVAQKGRDVLLKLNTTGSTYETVGGARTITITIGNTAVDVTNADDAGIRKLLEGAGVNSISVKLQGIYVDDDAAGLVRADAMTNVHRNYKVTIPGATGGGDLQGSFMISSLELAGAYNEGATSNMTLESAGAVSFTAAGDA
jgi:TP901-1 family phage major tail protein